MPPVTTVKVFSLLYIFTVFRRGSEPYPGSGLWQVDANASYLHRLVTVSSPFRHRLCTVLVQFGTVRHGGCEVLCTLCTL